MPNRSTLLSRGGKFFVWGVCIGLISLFFATDVTFAVPDNQPTGFAATADSSSQITVDWTDSTGTNLPVGYLVFCGTTSSFTPPVDGTSYPDDTDCSDGFGQQNILQGVETAVWSGLDAGTTYHFEIYPFDGAGATLEYLTTAVPTASAMTDNIIVPVPGTIEIIVDTVPNAAQDFSYSTGGGLTPTSFDLDDDSNGTLSNQETFTGVTAGTYTVEQTDVAGYVTTVECVDPTDNSSISDLEATIDLAAGETVSCTFTNTLDLGSITIVKEVVYDADVDIDSGQNFQFTSTELGNFQLDDPSSNDSDSITDTEAFADLTPGNYTITENNYSNWDQSVECVGDSGVTYLSPAVGATVDLDYGEDVVCTFTNERETFELTYAKSLVSNTAVPANPWVFNLADADGPSAINTLYSEFTSIPAAGGTGSPITLPSSDYRVGEKVPTNYDLVSIDCGPGGSANDPDDDDLYIDLDQDLTCTFTNAEGKPDLSISDAQVTEGDSGTAELEFTITRSNNAFNTEVKVSSSNGTASSNDYTAINNQTVSFSSGGDLSKTIKVEVKGDEVVEADETINLVLSAPVNGEIDDGTGVGTILNDDSATVTLSGAITVTEGDSGKLTYVYTAELDNAVQGGFKLEKDTTSGPGSGGAKAGKDFDDNDGLLTFAGNAGETQEIILKTRGDKQVEGDEPLTVEIGDFSSTDVDKSFLSTANDVIEVHIVNDDMATVSLVDGVAKVEGDSGTTNFVFTAKLDNPVDGGLKVDYSTAAGTAESGSDFTSKSGTLNFSGSAGETESITIKVKGDELVEADEIFTVALGEISDSDFLGSISLTNFVQEGTILNDDVATVTLTGGTAKEEGDSGTVSYTFTAELDADVDGGFELAYSTEDGSAKLADGDYVDNDGVLKFDGDKGESKTITVLANGDTKGESDETFAVVLDGATPETAGIEIEFSGSPQTSTILNDDAAVFFLQVEDEVGEEDGTLEVTVKLSAAATESATIEYSTTAGSATAGSDFTPVSGTLTFEVGESTKTFEVPILDDSLTEGDETFVVTISNPSAYGLGEPSEATVTIKDDESASVVSFVEPISGSEADGQISVTLKLDPPSVDTVTVTVQSADDGSAAAATAGVDYTAIDQAVTFAPGETTQTISVPVIDDDSAEGNETFTLTLKEPVNAGLPTNSSAQATIIDDEIRLIASIADVTVEESNEGQRVMLFEVTLNMAIAQDVSIQFSTQDDTAIAGEDYIASSGTLIIPAGRTKGTIGIFVLGDSDKEGDERFELLLFGANGVELDAPSGIKTVAGVIKNDDIFGIFVYLPLINQLASSAPGPDLVIQSIETAGGTLKVTVRNGGNQAVTKPFWVDVFFNPSVMPTKVNDTLASLNQTGLVWGVQGGVIPLGPNETVMLQVGDLYYDAAKSNLNRPIQSGDLIVVHVDSLNSSTTYGAVNESHEQSNSGYNNIRSATAVR